jgi:hypothetical protein
MTKALVPYTSVTTLGGRPDLGRTVYLGLGELTPWQEARVLEVSVSVERREYPEGTVWIPRVNPEDQESWEAVLAAEDIVQAGRDGTRWVRPPA